MGLKKYHVTEEADQVIMHYLWLQVTFLNLNTIYKFQYSTIAM